MRPPGFGPGSTAWKADVLDQTRLRSLLTGLRSFDGSIMNVLIKLKSLGKAESAHDIEKLEDNLNFHHQYRAKVKIPSTDS